MSNKTLSKYSTLRAEHTRALLAVRQAYPGFESEFDEEEGASLRFLEKLADQIERAERAGDPVWEAEARSALVEEEAAEVWRMEQARAARTRAMNTPAGRREIAQYERAVLAVNEALGRLHAQEILVGALADQAQKNADLRRELFPWREVARKEGWPIWLG